MAWRVGVPIHGHTRHFHSHGVTSIAKVTFYISCCFGTVYSA